MPRKKSRVGNEPTGHTAQYITLARALGLALQIAEDELTKIEAKGHGLWAAGTQIEARFVTIIVLAAAVCESLANTLLAANLAPPELKRADKQPTYTKWEKEVPKALDVPPFVSPQLMDDLRTLFRVRNSIMHPKPEVFAQDRTTIHAGTAHIWDQLADPSFVRRLASVPVRLSEAVPFSNLHAFAIADGVQEFVLMRALRHEPKAFESPRQAK